MPAVYCCQNVWFVKDLNEVEVGQQDAIIMATASIMLVFTLMCVDVHFCFGTIFWDKNKCKPLTKSITGVTQKSLTLP